MKNSKGQALVVLLVFMIVAVTITTAAVQIVIANSLAATVTEEGQHAMELSESGAENALIRLIRDPDYSGEILTVGDGSVTVTVTGTDTKTIRSDARLGAFVRTTVVGAQFSNTVLSVTNWQEEFASP